MELLSKIWITTKILFKNIIECIFLFSTPVYFIIDTFYHIFMTINVLMMDGFIGVELIEFGAYSLLLCLFYDNSISNNRLLL